MKKIMPFIIALLIFTACSTQNEVSDEITQSENISINIEETSATGAKFTITNQSEKTYMYGEDYGLHVLDGKNWCDVPYIIEDWAVVAIGYELNSQSSSQTIEIDWEWLYGKLPAGEYRLVKSFIRNSQYETAFGEFSVD